MLKRKRGPDLEDGLADLLVLFPWEHYLSTIEQIASP